jgi:hypothetical protein
MKDEGKRGNMNLKFRTRIAKKAEGRLRRIPSSFILHLSSFSSPSPFILHPSSFRLGVSLMEVLISVFVLSVGMLGLAALLPVGSLTILETIKADHAGDCGRAALRDVKIRRMVDPLFWSGSPNANLMSFVIDPLGIANSAPNTVAGTSLPRITLAYPPPPMAAGNAPQALTKAQAQAMFVWPDDLVIAMPEQMSPKQAFGRSQLPPDPDATRIAADGTQLRENNGDYSWFLSVTQTPDPARYRVTVVVCYRRDFSAERAVPVSSFLDAPSGGAAGSVAPGGGSIKLSTPISDTPSTEIGVRVRQNDWVALYSSSSGLCSWYRVVAVTAPDPSSGAQSLTLAGPDWTVTTSGGQDYMIALGQGVLGAYTTTVEVDRDPSWQQ